MNGSLSFGGGSGIDDDSHCNNIISSQQNCKTSLSLQKTTKKLVKDKTVREKYSPEQLKAIQARVKDSLKNQGVYLYDPFTGAGRFRDVCVMVRLHF